MLDRKDLNTRSVLREDLVCVDQMEMKIIDPALSAHRVVANPQILVLRNPEDLKQQCHQLITQYLRQSFSCEQKQNRMIHPQWVLIDQHGVQTWVEFFFHIYLGIGVSRCYDGLILEVDEEEDFVFVHFDEVGALGVFFEDG